MSDNNFKISKDKRHRSSSSLIANVLEGTYSERKLNIRASIPEVEDQFAVAESKCDELKEKLDMVRSLKKHKKRLKKRSMTRFPMGETPPPPPPPPPPPQPIRYDEDDDGGCESQAQSCAHDASRYISVQARPKKKTALPPTRVRRQPEGFRARNPTRSYVDPDTSEQRRMVDRVRDYDRTYTQQYLRMLQSLPQQASQHNIPAREAVEVPRRRIKRTNRSDREQGVQQGTAAGSSSMTPRDAQDCSFLSQADRKPKKRPTMAGAAAIQRSLQQEEVPGSQWTHQTIKEERPVVELFSKSRPSEKVERPGRRAAADGDAGREGDAVEARTVRNMKKLLQERASKTSSFLDGEGVHATPSKVISAYRLRRRGRNASRGYELPTVASRMKQRGARRSYAIGNIASIPFVVSKSTAPSHNIGVNIQQVLNGLKMQQPISGIPLTIAHHMGLRHTDTFGLARPVKSTPGESSLETHDINLIKLGRRLLRLPSYKYISYGRMLSLYREGDGMVPRFLRAMSKPNYFYQSMSSVSGRGDDIAPLRRRASKHEVKQSLAEYASLCREYETMSAQKCPDEATARRLEELARELNAREDHIRRVVTSYKSSAAKPSALRASASTLGGVEHVNSAYKLNTNSEV